MKYYRFKTFTTSYYFPDIDSSKAYMYGLYSPYGGKLSKLYWCLFRKYKCVRLLTSVKEEDLEFPYRQIKTLTGADTKLAFNMGSPGVEQKISMLGWDENRHQSFFAKFSQKPAARALTKNEITVYEVLEGTGLTPRLLNSKNSEDYDFIMTEYVEGKRPKDRFMNEQVLELAIKLSNFHLDDVNHYGNLLTCLSHGDFCPWNILVNGDRWNLIDWEVAAERPLGFDLFTYICQVAALFEKEKSLSEAIEENKSYINRYFNGLSISDWREYFDWFVKEKVRYESSKGNSELLRKYQELLYETNQ